MVMTMSPAAAASAALPAPLPPCSSRLATGPETTSWPVSLCCAFMRLAAIGAPILPRPIKPIIAICRFLPLVERQFIGSQRSEIAIGRHRVDLGQRRRPPLRLLVLVDQHRADALVEI